LFKKVMTIALAAAIWSTPGHTGSRANGEGKAMKSKFQVFKRMPALLTVRLKLVPHKAQRYDTDGDWFWHSGTLEIRLSREATDEDPRYPTLLFVHELVEALLCRSAGIDVKQVDRFDMHYVGKGEPGDDPAAPYHLQHVAAEAAERALSDQLAVDWKKYTGD
jgi:hypothetical protein